MVFKMYSNARKMTNDGKRQESDMPTQRTVMRGSGCDAPIKNYLRLVYDSNVHESLPQEFQDLLEQLD